MKRFAGRFSKDDPRIMEAITAYYTCGESKRAAAQLLNISRRTLQKRVDWAIAHDVKTKMRDPDFEVAQLPGEVTPVGEILERRKKEYARKHRAREARKLISVRINLDGPIGVCHMGDPHVDDPGTDIKTLEKHVNLIRDTKGLFGANVGDLQNNWIGRLSHLWGEQSTSKVEAWELTKWLVDSVEWLYLVGGNHDVWGGAGLGVGDPLQWMMNSQLGVYEVHGARLALKFPNGKEVRINCRHDFSGHSMWNTVHGVTKAFKMGWLDHILTCGHKHTTGYNILRDPASGLVGHAIRVPGYKIHDRYAEERGLPDQNISPACVTIIQPNHEDRSSGLVTTIWDVELAADILKHMRRDYD